MGWDMLFYLAASLLISAMMAPSVAQTNASPAAFDEFDFPQADEGTAQCVFFGECWSSDWTVLAVGNYRTTPIMSDGGGK